MARRGWRRRQEASVDAASIPRWPHCAFLLSPGNAMTESEKLSGRRVAVLATDGFEQSELTEPKRLLEVAGAHVDVIAPGGATQIKGWDKKNWGDPVNVDVALNDARPENYDALVLPGG